MIRHFKIFILFSLLSFSTQKAFANDCEGLNEGGSRWEACILAQDTKEIETQLNATYKKLSNQYKKNGSDEKSKMLIEAERAWISYRDKTCEFENEVIGGINSISWGRCYYRVTKERLDYFKDAGFY